MLRCHVLWNCWLLVDWWANTPLNCNGLVGVVHNVQRCGLKDYAVLDRSMLNTCTQLFIRNKPKPRPKPIIKPAQTFLLMDTPPKHPSPAQNNINIFNLKNRMQPRPNYFPHKIKSAVPSSLVWSISLLSRLIERYHFYSFILPKKLFLCWNFMRFSFFFATSPYNLLTIWFFGWKYDFSAIIC